jgi:hypothetical protein
VFPGVTQVVCNSQVPNTMSYQGVITGNGIANGQVVRSLNGLHDDVLLAAGTNVTITPSGQTLTISASGGGGGLGGSGTVNTIAKFTGATALGNSGLFESGGNVGLGMTNPIWPLDITAGHGVARLTSTTETNGSVVELRNTLASPAYLGEINFNNAANTFPGQIGYLGSNAMTFRTGGSERVRISSAGAVGIGVTSPTATLDVAGGIVERSPAHWGQCFAAQALYWDPATGNIGFPDLICEVTPGNTAPLSNVKDVLNLSAVKFTNAGATDVGLVPEEVSRSARDLVRFDKDGKPSGVKYERLSVYLLEIVKQQQKQIDELRATVDGLKRR